MWDQYIIISIYHTCLIRVGTDLEAIEICVEHVSTLDVSDQSHCKLLISLISDVHHGGDVYRKPIHP